jgi:hypothetical protein
MIEGTAERDRQNRTGKDRDRQNGRGRTGQTEENRQKRTDRAGYAKTAEQFSEMFGLLSAVCP